MSDERFRGDAVGQALDVERAERLRLYKENKELQVKRLGDWVNGLLGEWENGCPVTG